MAFTPNRIVLIGRGRYDEASFSADAYPGMALQKQSDGSCVPHAVVGGVGPLLIATEEALRGLDITQKLPTSYVHAFRWGLTGDKYLMLLKAGYQVTAGGAMMSAGDGTLIPFLGTKLYQINAPSAVVTATNVDTAYSNGTFAIPANTLQVGDVIHVRVKAFVVAENGTDTHRVRLYLGTAPITVADSAALQLAANDVVEMDVYLTVRTITAAGTVVASGTLAYTVSGTWTAKGIQSASATLDSTVAESLVVKVLPSSNNAGNQSRLDEFYVELDRAGGNNILVVADETKDNSGSTGVGPNLSLHTRVLVP